MVWKRIFLCYMRLATHCRQTFCEFSNEDHVPFFLIVFELGSLLCATAVNSPMLIVGRAIAELGALESRLEPSR